MNYLILIRHGQSKWNLEKRFTGWVDIDLTDNGILEAKKAGALIKKKNLLFLKEQKSRPISKKRGHNSQFMIVKIRK